MDIYEDMSALRHSQFRNLERHVPDHSSAPSEKSSRPPRIWLHRTAVGSLVLLCLLQLLLIIGLRCASLRPTNPVSNLEQVLEHGWSYYNYSLYQRSSDRMPWVEASKECKKKGAKLVIINNKEEQEFIQSILRHDYTWIGLTNMYSDWKWVDGTPETGTIWKNDPLQSECMIIYPTEMRLTPCTDPHYWICEKLVYH